MKATREQVLAMARKAGFLKREIELQRASIEYLAELAQQFTLDQLMAQGSAAYVNPKDDHQIDVLNWGSWTPLYRIPETLE